MIIAACPVTDGARRATTRRWLTPMGARADEAAARSERARAIGLFRYQLIREAADPAHSTRARGRLVRAVAAVEHTRPDRAAGAGLARHAGPVDPGVAARRVRRAGAQPAPVGAAVAGRGGRDGGRAQAGEPGPDRRAGPPDPGAPRWGGRRASGPCNAGSPTTRSIADLTRSGRGRAGVRAVRGVAAQRVVDR